MKTFSVCGNSEAEASDRDDLKHLYREVQRLRTLHGVLKCGSAAGPASSAVDNRNQSRTVHGRLALH
ncbi:hypothetical protein [Bradyrhizobium sp. LTSPM299]|jgi:hypothetical protein|uniref:hypothetical protein n=1 Tax=Bradyrhizobium sp. LTSPM299 TaxID=1619233 RepID=UPI0012E27D07|nr:hypothetical protein [Bradyrhizobium sp. LTSPM299]